MHHLKGQHVLILGLGASGLAMAKWCVSRGASVSVADTRAAPPNLAVLQRDCPAAQFIAGAFTADILHTKSQSTDDAANVNIRAVFKSPGLTPEEVAPVWSAAKEMGLWVGTELSLFTKALSELKEEMGYEPSVLAITGTNGKTTVTSLTAQMLSRGGLRTVVAGNIGPTLLGTLSEQLELIKDIPAELDEEDLEGLDPSTAQANALNEADVSDHTSSDDSNDDSNDDSINGSVDSLKGHSTDHSTNHATNQSTDEPTQVIAQAVHAGGEQSVAHEVGAVDVGDATEAAEVAEAVEVAEAAEGSENNQDTEDVSVLNLMQKGQNPEHKKYKKHRNILPQAWVLELSSFQLNDCEDFEPTAAAILNITEDHLDWHPDMQSYINAKSKVFGERSHQILCRDDAHVLALRPAELDAKALKKAKADAQANETQWFEREVITYGSDLPSEPGHYGLETVNGMTWLVKAVDPSDDSGEVKSRRKKTPVQADELIMQRLMPADALRIRGAHNALNALAALALCSTARATSVGHGPMLYALREYRGEPHRVEPVARISDVEYFDDSKGTNVGATIAAVKGLGAEHRLIVILGGEGKGQDFAPLCEPLSKYAKLVILMGRDAPVIKDAIQHIDVPVVNAQDLKAAVQIAHERAEFGDAVLMSPACASFDMFDNYEHRAQVFVQAVRELALEVGVV